MAAEVAKQLATTTNALYGNGDGSPKVRAKPFSNPARFPQCSSLAGRHEQILSWPQPVPVAALLLSQQIRAGNRHHFQPGRR